MRLVADISSFQTHTWEWDAWQPIDLAAFAGAVDGCWVRWTDWSGYVRWGADPGHRHVIDTLRDLGKPVGSYLYPRPEMSSPQTQIDQWFAETPALSWAPMLDAEATGGLSGPNFSAWVDAALAEMAQKWQRTPWLYTQASKVRSFGLTRPSTPHHLLLAEYHQDEQVFGWADRAGWEAHALSEGPPETPPGWDGYDAWQFTQKAEVPGMNGVIDCSWVTEAAFKASSGGGADDGFAPTDRQTLHDLRRTLGGTT